MTTSLCLPIALRPIDQGAGRSFIQLGFNDIPHLATGLTQPRDLVGTLKYSGEVGR
jgi:hypothetical protein